MAKLNKSNLKKIDLEDITLKSNVRIEYKGIEELAGSIERDGQIQPVAVKPDPENEDKYILIAGRRRFKAHEYLVSIGKPFNQIEAVIKHGDFDILQLTENIQREDLTPKELEAGLKKMLDSGLSQVEIGKRLNKSKSWVCDGLKANEVRVAAESQGIKTDDISTGAMTKLRSVPKDDLPKVIKEVKKNGGTVKAVKDAVSDIEIDPFKGLRREVSKLKKEFRLDYIVKMVGEM